MMVDEHGARRTPVGSEEDPVPTGAFVVRRVLIAEDDPAMRVALASLIAADDGLQLVASVGDAVEAIEAAVAQRPDVCIVDVSMPGGGGPMAAREIRAQVPDARVLALSGREDRPTVVEMLRAGASGYVVKGIGPDELLAAIHRTADGQATLSPAVTDGVVGELAEHLARDEATRRRHDAASDAIQRVLSEGQFHMAFQPICRLKSAEPIGFEALARFGLEPRQPPDVWFERAGEVGLLLELEIEAVRAALPALDTLAESTFLAVNVSPTTIVSPRFLSSIVGTGRGAQIVVEVTEHAPIDDYDAVNAALTRLRAHGVRLAVDDAGAGFASLRHIVRLEPDFIKIDGELTRNVGSDRSQRALTSALIAFARETGATIVAEGLETDEQIATLRGIGVEVGQGYRLGRPGPLNVPADRS